MSNTILTIISDVYCNNEYADSVPHCAVIYLTQKDLDRYKKLSALVKENGAYSINLWEQCCWFDRMPLWKFQDLNRYLIAGDVDRDEEMFEDEPHEDDDPELDFGSLGSEFIVVTESGFYFAAYGKHSGDKLETIEVQYSTIDTILEQPAAPRHEYFFPNQEDEDVKHPVSLDEVPKYINDDNPVISHYYKEYLKYGGDFEST